MIGNSGDETNFPHKLLLTNRQVANLSKDFANYLSIWFLHQFYIFKTFLQGCLLGIMRCF